jgi:hypothetical protein
LVFLTAVLAEPLILVIRTTTLTLGAFHAHLIWCDVWCVSIINTPSKDKEQVLAEIVLVEGLVTFITELVIRITIGTLPVGGYAFACVAVAFAGGASSIRAYSVRGGSSRSHLAGYTDI